MGLLLAMQFLTRIPITIRGKVEEKQIARSMSFFPLVGLILGLCTAGIYQAVAYLTGASVGNLAAIAFIVIITGNMHLDGLMDTADGIFSGRTREGMLEVMKDSRVGAHGVAAGVLALLAKFVLLGQITSVNLKLVALIVIPLLSRWTQVYGAALYPYARKNGGKSGFTDLVGRRELFWSSITVILAVIALLGLQYGFLVGAIKGLIVFIAVFSASTLLGKYFTKKLGGVTGDTLGATTECVELMVLFLLVAGGR